ncbi:MAG: SRPBCC family protein [Hyphomonadaceae bacterium]|nr:SRPBCC family protein [Hyphomonadaceae bacterium]
MTSPNALMKPSVVHETVVLERTYKASPARVFAAWESVEARLRWSKPYPDTGLAYDAHDFRVGGKDILRCGPADDLRFHAEVYYLDIVPGKRLIFSERINEAGKPMATALLTVEFRAKGQDTHQLVTMQIAALDGSDMVEGYKQGWEPTLDNLAKEF